MAVYVGQGDQEENVSTADKVVQRCEACDRETDDWVMFIAPNNTERIVCWSCQERDDKNYTMKPGHRAERSGGRYLPKSPKFD